MEVGGAPTPPALPLGCMHCVVPAARPPSNWSLPPSRLPCLQTGGIPGVGGRMVPNAAMLQRASLVKVH